MIDLYPFCGVDPARDYLCRPFRYGLFTYATNGHIMVRVAPVAGSEPLPEPAARWNVRQPLDWCHAGANFVGLPDGALDRLPVFEEIPCFECGSAPRIDPECESCGGVGFDYKMISAAIGGALFHARYIRMVLELPGVELALPVMPRRDNDFQALAFRFDGGIGALCLLRSPYADHVGEIIPPRQGD